MFQQVKQFLKGDKLDNYISFYKQLCCYEYMIQSRERTIEKLQQKIQTNKQIYSNKSKLLQLETGDPKGENMSHPSDLIDQKYFKLSYQLAMLSQQQNKDQMLVV